MNSLEKFMAMLRNEDSIVENKMSLSEWHEKCLQECPQWIVEKSVSFLSRNIPEDVKEQIREEWKNDPEHWATPFHFSYGMFIRNQLRNNVCSDDKLPTGNFDDYYVPFIEIACGIRDWI